jgi:hypothetical protein
MKKVYEDGSIIEDDAFLGNLESNKKTAMDKIMEYRLSDPSECRYWTGHYEALDNTIAKYLSFKTTY